MNDPKVNEAISQYGAICSRQGWTSTDAELERLHLEAAIDALIESHRTTECAEAAKLAKNVIHFGKGGCAMAFAGMYSSSIEDVTCEDCKAAKQTEAGKEPPC